MAINVTRGTAKAYCRINGTGTLHPNHLNISSVSVISTGRLTINFDTDFANTNLVAQATGSEFHTETAVEFGTYAVGSIEQRRFNPNGGALVNYATANVFFGDH